MLGLFESFYGLRPFLGFWFLWLRRFLLSRAVARLYRAMPFQCLRRFYGKSSNLQIFKSSYPNYYYLCRAILLAQLCWRNKVAVKIVNLNENEIL